jgi:NAD(P)-dependent dehydrogenase (short-subunit alcohol dehydrogenase family)
MLNLANKTVLITGGNQGIGWAVARLLASQGARIAVNYPDNDRRPMNLEDLGDGAISVEGDVSILSDIDAMFDRVLSEFGQLDVLVNNAGVFPRASVFDLDEATWDTVIDINLKGTFFCAQRAARHMVELGSGRIINVASDSALVGSPVGAHYCASKAGIVSLTKSLAMALAPYGILVNSIAPGLTDTAQPRFGWSEKELVERSKSIPLGRMAQPSDIALTVLFLASDLSTYVTGQTLFANGGSLMVP